MSASRRIGLIALLVVLAIAFLLSLRSPASAATTARAIQPAAGQQPLAISTAAERAAALELQLRALRNDYAQTLARAKSAEAKVAERDRELVDLRSQVVDDGDATKLRRAPRSPAAADSAECAGALVPSVSSSGLGRCALPRSCNAQLRSS